MTELLLKAGADANVKDNAGKSALMMAASEGIATSLLCKSMIVGNLKMCRKSKVTFVWKRRLPNILKIRFVKS